MLALDKLRPWGLLLLLSSCRLLSILLPPFCQIAFRSELQCHELSFSSCELAASLPVLRPTPNTPDHATLCLGVLIGLLQSGCSSLVGPPPTPPEW